MLSVKIHSKSVSLNRLWRISLLAGLAGGLAEVLWIFVYGFIAGDASMVVAYEIANSLLPAALVSPITGIALHFALALGIAILFTFLLWQPVLQYRSAILTVAVSLACLAAIWAFNFFVLLPVLNPEFIQLLPLTVTFVSKLLFGLAMAIVYANNKP